MISEILSDITDNFLLGPPAVFPLLLIVYIFNAYIGYYLTANTNSIYKYYLCLFNTINFKVFTISVSN